MQEPTPEKEEPLTKRRRWWFERDHFKDAERRVRPFADRLAWCPPNVLTLAGLLLAIAASWAFLDGRLALGAACFALSAFTDLFDGPVARLQEAAMTPARRQAEAMTFFLFRKGQTRFGTAFDPVVDKARYFGALFPLGVGKLWSPLIWAALGFAAALTLIRLPLARKAAAWIVSLFASRRPPEEARTPEKVPGSNKLGKLKVHVEIGVIAALVLLPPSAAASVVQHVLLAVATLGGLTSLAGHLMTAYEESKAPA